VKLGDMALASRAIRAAAFGPGIGVWRNGLLRSVITPGRYQTCRHLDPTRRGGQAGFIPAVTRRALTRPIEIRRTIL